MNDTTSDFPACGPVYRFDWPTSNCSHGTVWLNGKSVSCHACKPGPDGWVLVIDDDGLGTLTWGSVTCAAVLREASHWESLLPRRSPSIGAIFDQRFRDFLRSYDPNQINWQVKTTNGQPSGSPS